MYINYDNDPYLSTYLGIDKNDYKETASDLAKDVANKMFNMLDAKLKRGEMDDFKENDLVIKEDTIENIRDWLEKKVNARHSAEYGDFVRLVIYPRLLKDQDKKNIDKLKLMAFSTELGVELYHMMKDAVKPEPNKYRTIINFINPKITGIKEKLKNRVPNIEMTIKDWQHLSHGTNASLWVVADYKPNFKYKNDPKYQIPSVDTDAIKKWIDYKPDNLQAVAITQKNKYSKKELDNLKVGDNVKISDGTERFWVLIKKIDGDVITGNINNELLKNKKYNINDIIKFKKEKIIDIQKKIVKIDNNFKKLDDYRKKNIFSKYYLYEKIAIDLIKNFIKIYNKEAISKLNVKIKDPNVREIYIENYETNWDKVKDAVIDLYNKSFNGRSFDFYDDINKFFIMNNLKVLTEYEDTYKNFKRRLSARIRRKT